MNYDEQYILENVDNDPNNIWPLINDVRDTNFCDRKVAVRYVIDVLYNNNRGHVAKHVAKDGYTQASALLLSIFIPPWAMILMEGKIFSWRIFISCILSCAIILPGSIQALIYYFVNRKYWPFWS